MNYVFMTDASCDLSQSQVNEIGIEVLPMEFQMEGKCYLHYPDYRMMGFEEFYDKIRAGVHSTTTQINFENFKIAFENYLKAGKDVLYTGISSGLSGTYNTCLMAVNDLKEKYPERKIIALDSCCDSLGLGLLLYLAGKKYREGAGIDEVAQFIEETKHKVCHWFVVDDLDHLKRGGRISAVSATFGKALQIKPLLSVDNTGKLVNIAKIRGKSNVLSTLVKYAQRDAEDLKNGVAFIAHSSNREEAEELKKLLKGLCNEIQICDIGPIIGSHTGTGVIAVTFLGKRNLEA